ncbi:hypothetical protein JD82_00005 [Prauserella rugosa]|uniref:Uncharacterized protein n=1 Tax=Prauserella rugosa TaxID=43354 RepID=A0A660CB95_9PSEU|nr:hypothetical protein JD82_00005 [Prauserella rugosa]
MVTRESTPMPKPQIATVRGPMRSAQIDMTVAPAIAPMLIVARKLSADPSG